MAEHVTVEVASSLNICNNQVPLRRFSLVHDVALYL